MSAPSHLDSSAQRGPPSTSDFDDKSDMHVVPLAEKQGVVADAAAPESAPKEEDVITGWRLNLVFAALGLVAFLMLLDISIVATAIPRITSDFHSLEDVGWYGSAYLLANCALQPLAGKVYTHFHSKAAFLGFFALFELGSLLCGVSNSSKMLIVSRAIAGMGGAGLMNGALTIIAVAVPLHKRPVYMGGMMGVAQMGVVVGPLLGGAFTQYTTWRWCFYINLPIGAVVALLLILIRIPDNVKTRTESVWKTILNNFDLVGFVLFAPAVIMFLLALEWGGNTYAWNSATIIGLFCGAVVLFGIFIAWEAHVGAKAMIPLSLFKIRAVSAACGYVFFLFSAMQLVVYYLPIYFQAVKDTSPMISGVDLLPSILSQLIATLGSGALITKIGYYLPFAVASSVVTTVGHGLLTLLEPNSSIGIWIGFQIVVGFGRGLGMQTPFIALQNNVEPQLISIATSTMTFTQTFSGAVMLSMAQTIFTSGLRELIPKYAPGVSAQKVIQAGATGVWATITDPTELAQVLIAYNISIRRIYYVAIGFTGACFIISWFLGWKDIRKKPAPKAGAEQA